jgi:hypothetical protein
VRAFELGGPPGSRSGTLGLKEGCGWSEWFGGVGFVRDSKKICPVGSDWSGDVGMVRGIEREIFEAAIANVQRAGSSRKAHTRLYRLARMTPLIRPTNWQSLQS